MGGAMKCPHCLHAYHPQVFEWGIHHTGGDGAWKVRGRVCAGCGKVNFELVHGTMNGQHFNENKSWLVYPRGSGRPPCPAEVPAEYRKSYAQACLVLADSPDASAALGRRCLQLLLRKHLQVVVKSGRLKDELDDALAQHKIPSTLIEFIDMPRVLGNLGAHPEEDRRTGEIVDVAPGEAEAVLDLLEELFEHYFVRPAAMRKKKGELEAKLAAARQSPSASS